MNKLVHGIAVVIGFVLWKATGNIIIAAVLAVIAEGIILAVSVAVAQHKKAVVAAAAERRTLPKSLWWPITIVAVSGILLVAGILSLVFTAEPVVYNGEVLERPSEVGRNSVIIILALVALLAFGIISIVKAKRHNAKL